MKAVAVAESTAKAIRSSRASLSPILNWRQKRRNPAGDTLVRLALLILYFLRDSRAI